MRSLIKSSSFSEADLASAFLRASSSLNFGRHSYNFVDELETLAGIPDAVGINSSDLNQLQSFRARYKKFDFTNGHAKILARLKTTRVISETTTLALTGMNPDYFYKHLASLERRGDGITAGDRRPGCHYRVLDDPVSGGLGCNFETVQDADTGAD